MPDTHAKPPDTPTTTTNNDTNTSASISVVGSCGATNYNNPIPESTDMIKNNNNNNNAHQAADIIVDDDASSTTTSSSSSSQLDASIAEELAKIYSLLGRTLPPAPPHPIFSKTGTSADPQDITTNTTTNKKVRICVLIPSYADSDSATKDWDDIPCGPQNYLLNYPPPNNGAATSTSTFMGSYFEIETIALQKATCFKTIRSLISSNQYDVFFNLCDGGEDEDRAGVEVVRTLEKFGAPFTGAQAKYYEVSKPTMKMVAHYNDILAPRGVVIKSNSHDEVIRKCSGLTFPVIIKHASGYGSVGMTKDCKCTTMEELQSRIIPFIQEYDVALVEEFIIGSEATVLACADDTQPDGIRVFIPVMVSFPPGEDFKHFDLKWRDYDGMQWVPVTPPPPPTSTTTTATTIEDDISSSNQQQGVVDEQGGVPPTSTPLPQPSSSVFSSPYDAICDMGRKAFKSMCGGVGYGRCDVRIAEGTNDVYFLEINPNCGILYPDGLEGSADWILKLDPTSSHVHFILLQIRSAIARSQAMKPIFIRDYTPARGYHLVAERDIIKGTTIIASSSPSSAILPTTTDVAPVTTAPLRQPLTVTKTLLDFGTSAGNNNNHAADMYAAQQLILQQLLSLDAAHHQPLPLPPLPQPIASSIPQLLQWGNDPDADWHPINHTCNTHPHHYLAANVSWTAAGSLVALRDIQTGSELLMNYHHHHGIVNAHTTAFTAKIAPCPSCGKKYCHISSNSIPTQLTTTNTTMTSAIHNCSNHSHTMGLVPPPPSDASSSSSSTSTTNSSPEVSCLVDAVGGIGVGSSSGIMMAASLEILDQILMLDSQQQRPAFGFSPSSLPEGGATMVPISPSTNSGGFRDSVIINR